MGGAETMRGNETSCSHKRDDHTAQHPTVMTALANSKIFTKYRVKLANKSIHRLKLAKV